MCLVRTRALSALSRLAKLIPVTSPPSWHLQVDANDGQLVYVADTRQSQEKVQCWLQGT